MKFEGQKGKTQCKRKHIPSRVLVTCYCISLFQASPKQCVCDEHEHNPVRGLRHIYTGDVRKQQAWSRLPILFKKDVIELILKTKRRKNVVYRSKSKNLNVECKISTYYAAGSIKYENTQQINKNMKQSHVQSFPFLFLSPPPGCWRHRNVEETEEEARTKRAEATERRIPAEPKRRLTRR